MRVRLAEKILTMFGIKGGKPDQYGNTHKSDQYQLAYKVGEMILKDASDYDIMEICQERKLMPNYKCDKCGQEEYATFSDNGVLDAWNCPNADGITGKHKPIKKGLLKRVLGRS